jgi:hypothetical protein
MQYIVLGAIALLLLIGIGQLFIRSDPRTLVQLLRYIVGGVLIIVGGILTWGGRWGFGLPMIAIGVTALARGRIGPLDLGGTATRSSSRGDSAVRTAFLEMRLDHDSGAMAGRVIAGRYSGQILDDLAPDALRELLGEVAADSDSVALFEVYLDRRIPGWREDFQHDPASGAGRTPGTGAMSEEEAYQVLGLAPGASPAQIRAAHRRLMKLVHPDQGGSTFLAAKINQAKDKLLGGHN